MDETLIMDTIKSFTRALWMFIGVFVCLIVFYVYLSAVLFPKECGNAAIEAFNNKFEPSN
jgi:hypothetical protein